MFARTTMAALLCFILLGGVAGSIGAQSGSGAADLRIYATNCPDNAYNGRDFDASKCDPGIGIAFELSTESGSYLGGCVASDLLNDGTAAGCVINGVPYETTVVASQDLSSLPVGVEPEEGNSVSIYTSIPTSAANLTVGFTNRLLTDAVPTDAPVATTEPASPDSAPTAPVSGPNPNTSSQPAASATSVDTSSAEGSTAAVFAGVCDDETFEDPLTRLTDVAAPAGDLRGANNASAVETSFTTITPVLDDLLGDDHVVVVFDEDSLDVVLACGDIGGVIAEDGSLAIGLRSQGDSRFSGVAYLAPSSEGTAVSIFLAEDLNDEQHGSLPSAPSR